MSRPVPQNIRNVAVIGHGGAGKATLIEALLYQAKAISARGAADKGNLAMMVEPEEASRKIAITPHLAHFRWNDTLVHLVDCPGYFNFLENTRSVLPGVDGAVVLISGVEGVKPETERLWAMLNEAQVPVIGFVNMLDDEQADFEKAASTLHEYLKVAGQPVVAPLGTGVNLTGLVDLLRMAASSESDGKTTPADIPDNLRNDLTQVRTQLVEKIAESSDSLLEKYLEGAELTQEELETGLRAAVAKRAFVPLFAGSGLKNVGVNALLEGIVRFLPNPVERDALRPINGFDPGDLSKEIGRSCDVNQPFCATVIKTTIDPFSGKLSIVRVVSGSAKSNQMIYNTTRQQKQKIGHPYLLQGKELVSVEELVAGQIGALSKLDETKTGDTISDSDDLIVLPAVKLAEPPVMYAVEPEGKADEKVASGLTKLSDEDPTLRLHRDEQTHELIVAGMGQTHIEVILERLARKFGGKAKLKTPRVPYRETIRKTIKAEGKLKKQTGGHGQFADCWLEVAPQPRDGGFEFVDQIVGGIIPKQYIPAIEKGVREAMLKGSLGGFPVVDVKVSVYDGKFHDVDSSDYAFQVAGSLGFKSAVEQAAPVLLEPIMTMKVICPEECTGDVLKDLSSRRGRVISLNSKGSRQEIDAEAPMAEILEYGNMLSAITSGRGSYTMSLASYREVPAQIQERVLQAHKALEEAKEE